MKKLKRRRLKLQLHPSDHRYRIFGQRQSSQEQKPTSIHPASTHYLGLGCGERSLKRDIPPILTPDSKADLSKLSDGQLATDKRTGRYRSHDMQPLISNLQESSHKTKHLSPASVGSAIEPCLPERSDAQPRLPQTAQIKGNDNLNQISLQRGSFFKPPKTAVKWGRMSRDHKPPQTQS